MVKMTSSPSATSSSVKQIQLPEHDTNPILIVIQNTARVEFE